MPLPSPQVYRDARLARAALAARRRRRAATVQQCVSGAAVRAGGRRAGGTLLPHLRPRLHSRGVGAAAGELYSNLLDSTRRYDTIRYDTSMLQNDTIQ